MLPTLNILHIDVNFYKYPHVSEREKERIAEKKQRVSESKKMATTVTTGKVEETPKLMEAPTSTPAAPHMDSKELKIEVHATAVHHEKLEPIVAHAQTHELHHDSASVRFYLLSFNCRLEL